MFLSRILRTAVLAGATTLPLPAALVTERTLTSPDGALVFHLERDDAAGTFFHSVTRSGQPVVTRGLLGVEITGVGVIADEGTISDVTTRQVDTTWTDPFGERSTVPDRFHEETLTLSHASHGTRVVKLQVRAYDEGIAFRYLIEGGSGTVASEKTSFPLPAAAQVWTSPTAQGAITRQAVSSISGAVERPLLAELGPALYAALGEAALVDGSRMRFTRSGTSTLVASLAAGMSYSGSFTGAWRYIRAAPSPGGLLEGNHFLLNLNEPSKILDTSWIRPGKVLREVTLTTQGGLACIDFAAAHDLRYILFDAGWYGPEGSASSDATTVTIDPARSPGPLDLPAVIAYGKTKGVDVILYVNQIALSQQLDDILPLYQSWGVAGIKFGFVTVGSQAATRWLHEAVEKCARHQLMVNIHDEYRPTGLSRTWPNLLTQEGIRGDEESPTNAAVLNTLFTRGLAGAGDQTNVYFASRVATMGSHASQLAKSVCIFSPWQFLYWYDRPAGSPGVGGAGSTASVLQEVPELTFFDRLPTTWDESRVLAGHPTTHAVIARRKGGIWFLGALNGNAARQIAIPLDFLASGQRFRLEQFRDDPTAPAPTRVAVRTSVVDRSYEIRRTLSAGNGLAALLTPTTDPLTPPEEEEPPPVEPAHPAGTIRFETDEGYPAAALVAERHTANADAPFSGIMGWSLSTSTSTLRTVGTAASGGYWPGQAVGTDGSGTYIGGLKGAIQPAAAHAIAFDAQYHTGITVGFMKDRDGDGRFDPGSGGANGDAGMGFGVGGATTVRFQRRAAAFGTETASPLAGTTGQWYRFLITIGESTGGSRPITMAVRNLTTATDLDFDPATAGAQPWSFAVTDAEFGPAPETADGVFIRMTGGARIDNLRVTVRGTPYQSWISGFPALAGSAGDAAADPDGDGVANLLEWVLGGDPTVPDRSILPEPLLSAGELKVTFRRRGDAVVFVQHATALEEPAWSEFLLTTASGSSGDVSWTVESDGPQTARVIIRLPIDHPPRRFVRLRVVESLP